VSLVQSAHGWHKAYAFAIIAQFIQVIGQA